MAVGIYFGLRPLVGSEEVGWMELFSLLHNMDKLTLEILFMKMDGYGSKEISEKTGLSVNAIDLRIFKLKKKLKNFL